MRTRSEHVFAWFAPAVPCEGGELALEDGKGFDCVDEGGGVSVPDVYVADYDCEVRVVSRIMFE